MTKNTNVGVKRSPEWKAEATPRRTKKVAAAEAPETRKLQRPARTEPSNSAKDVTKTKTRKTVAQWRKVLLENPIARQIGLVRFKLADVGQVGGVGLRALYICGPQGVGKTHSIVEQEAVWRSRKLRPIRCRPRNVHELVDQFKEAKGLGPLIMEEADIIFRSKPMFEILKQATDPKTPDIFSRMEKTKEGKVRVDINLNVPIVVSTNMDLWDDTQWDKTLMNDRDALFERSAPIVLMRDPFMLWEWSVYLALASHLTRDVCVRNPSGGRPLLLSNSLIVQSEAISWFTDNARALKSISPRTLKKVSEIFGRRQRGDMPDEIATIELQALLGEARAMPQPTNADWAKLLQEMPKASSTGSETMKPERATSR
ncbi:hypothetical protein [Qipengyuania huizhouensis]|uniref:hypothetical protein n=1 Tax=Qipengyuania huizhouensis TaxID=2867245 RepID=UPI001C871242|nr:hypothetical protein [Qipengyuania huizhouensis]MBX7459842.1 hypothetical protein [Qipengyuania huizhouensis]